MQLKKSKTLDAGRRVQGFLVTQAPTLGGLVTPAIRAQLDDAVEKLTAFQLEQDWTAGTAKEETQGLDRLRKELFEQFLRPIGNVAKRALAGTNELSVFLIPAFAVHTGRVGEFVAAADNFVAAATEHEQQLIQYGAPSDFLGKLRDAIARLDSVGRSRDTHVGRRVASTKGLDAKDNAVRAAIDEIDSFVRPALKSDASLLAQWMSAKKIVKTAVTPNPTGTAPDQTPSTISSASSTAPATPPVLNVADGNKAAA